MTWLVPLIRLLIAVADIFAGRVADRDRDQVGQAIAATKHLRKAFDAVTKAKDARARVERGIARDPGGVRDDDGFRRD